MTSRLFAFPALVAAGLVLAAPAVAQDEPVVLVNPADVEPDAAVDDPAPFTYRTFSPDEEWPNVNWVDEEGLANEYDTDPRAQHYLPRPQPGIVFDLR